MAIGIRTIATLACLAGAITAVNTPIGAAETHDLKVSRVFEAPVEELWKAWSETDRLMEWWGPEGFTAPIVRMDFREGGRSLVCMRSPQGQDFCNTWSYQQIEPTKSIAFELGWSDAQGQPVDPAAQGLPPDLPQTVPHRITFRDLGDGRSELAVEEYGYASEQTVDLSRAGLESSLNKLDALLARR